MQSRTPRPGPAPAARRRPNQGGRGTGASLPRARVRGCKQEQSSVFPPSLPRAGRGHIGLGQKRRGRGGPCGPERLHCGGPCRARRSAARRSRLASAPEGRTRLVARPAPSDRAEGAVADRLVRRLAAAGRHPERHTVARVALDRGLSGYLLPLPPMISTRPDNHHPAPAIIARETRR
jgi:hypothetical protein